MSDGISLSHLHEVPWSNIEGAYVKVRQETTEYDYLRDTEPQRTTEIREGVIVGRAQGRGLYYDSERNENIPTSIGPSIYLDTPEDTILEVRTDKTENELLEFEPADDD